jgi:uncharacterized membrane protein
MIDQTSILITIALMAGVVYLTRLSGYFIGLQLRHISGIKPILETLPGCAFMAILAPAVRQGSLSEIAAMACLVVLMWLTNNVVVSTIVGMVVLFAGNVYLR